jgi:hypothetical protein
MNKPLKFFLLLLSILLFLQGCERKTTSYESEKFILDKFFKYLMLNESGIYTLIGSKPITDIWFLCENQDEQIKRWGKLSEKEKENRVLLFNKDKKTDMDFYRTLPKKLRKRAFVIPDKDYLIDFECFVENWNLIKKVPCSNRYLLVGKEGFSKKEKEGVFRIVFVDVLKTALVIQENYSLFKDFVGFDFDPVSVIMELKEDKSIFWDKLKGEESSFLWGILYGFGKENSLCYLWKHKHKFLNKIESFDSEEFIPTPSLRNFSIPAFASFFENDPVVKKYKNERNAIQKEYQGKDFLNHTLKILCGN